MIGQLEPLAPTRTGPNRKLHPAALESLQAYLRQYPFTYQDELKVFLDEEWGIQVSKPTICRRMKELDILLLEP